MLKTIPGTTLPLTPAVENDAFSVFIPILSATNGLTLSQLCDLVGLQATTIQNWVKRGWVVSPEGKRYCQTQLARILLINLLRGSMQLDRIVALMQVINGSVADSSDDIIADVQLYNHVCSILFTLVQKANSENLFITRAQILKEIDSCLAGYVGPHENARQTLRQALLVMLLAYVASERKKEAEYEFSKLLKV